MASLTKIYVYLSSNHIIAPEHLTIDLGIPEHIRKVQITFPTANELDFELQLSYDLNDEDSWTTIDTASSISDTSITLSNVPDDAVGRYLRLYFTGGYSLEGGYPPGKYYSVSNVKVWRVPRVSSTNPTNTYCESNALKSTR